MDNQSTDNWEPFWPPPPRCGSPGPRGLLPVPPDVEKLVAREKTRLRPYFTDEAEKRIRDDFTLQYYYEGETVACLETAQGVEVLAVGLEEIGALMKTMTQDELLQIRIRHP